MISGHIVSSVGTHTRRFLLSAVLVATCIVGNQASAQFGFGNFNRQGVVGGVSVDAQGALRQSTVQERKRALEQLRKSLVAGDTKASDLRVVSLVGLQKEIESAVAEKRAVSEYARFMAGLQRVEYVFVDDEKNDILLAGPAEAWTVRDDASVVGVKSGRPVLQLEDLLVALSTVEDSRKAAISVSIDPTPEGAARLQKLLRTVRVGAGFNPSAIEPSMKQAFGAQQVSLTTVDTSSRMAATLVAADYNMKRLAMDIDESPVRGLPSYMDMIRNVPGATKTQQRWWLDCKYDSIRHSADHKAWKLDGLGVKAMTEDEHVDSAGNRTRAGKSSPIAQRWADNFTGKFDELCQHNASFGDLRNVMDLNVVATVISAHQLESLAGCDLGGLRGESFDIKMPTWQTPKTVSPECSFVKGSAGWVVSASGGVSINPWKVVATSAVEDEAVASVSTKAIAKRSSEWWWD